MDRTNYDESFKLALQSPDPIAFIQGRWGDPKPYFNEFVMPYVSNRTNLNVVEIGSGLGRYTNLVAPYSNKIYAVEPSEICRSFLFKHFGGKVNVLVPNTIDTIPNNIDIMFSFSTMLHFSLYEMWWYIKDIAAKLVVGGKMIIHYSSFESISGDDLFVQHTMKEFGDGGIYCFHESSQLRVLGKHAKMNVIVDKEPKAVIVPGHRVMVLCKE
jgi:SAM-dependent methyltransferase